MEKTIKVTGTGVYKVKPDMQRIWFSCDEPLDTYEECLKKFEEKSKTILNLMESIGVDKNCIKINDFDVTNQTEFVEEKIFNKVTRKQKFVGYNLKLAYDIITKKDTSILGKILCKINEFHEQSKNISLYVSINYFFKNDEEAKEKAIELACENCNKRAKILSKSSRVILGDIINIDYSWNNIIIRGNDISRQHLYGEGPVLGCDLEDEFLTDFELNVRDIEYKAEVNTIYEIK